MTGMATVEISEGLAEQARALADGRDLAAYVARAVRSQVLRDGAQRYRSELNARPELAADVDAAVRAACDRAGAVRAAAWRGDAA